jgi:DNA-binding transcriptional ArsR family regulator
MTLTSLAQVRVISDPWRMQLIQLLRGEPKSVKELAAAMGKSPKQLYYHVNLLEQHEIIRVVGTRLVSGIVERRYQARAYLLTIEESLLGREAPAEMTMATVLTSMFNQSSADILQGIRSGLIERSEDAPAAHRLLNAWNLHRLTNQEAEYFYTKVCELIAELPGLQRDDDPGETATYRLLLALYPSSYIYQAPQTGDAEEQDG